jgi:hypothetical protein
MSIEYPNHREKVKEHCIPLSGLSKLRTLTEKSVQTLHQVLRVHLPKNSSEDYYVVISLAKQFKRL